MQNFTKHFLTLFAILLFGNSIAQTYTNKTLANWTFEQCNAGTPITYAEFEPTTTDAECGLTYSTVHRMHPTDELSNPYKHSCVEGNRSGTKGICASGFSADKFFDELTTGNAETFAFQFTVDIPAGKTGVLSDFTFWQKAPEELTFGTNRNNNYPQKFGIKVTKLVNGSSQTIFREIDLPTTRIWGEKVVDFTNINEFTYEGGEQFLFQLYAYEPFENNGLMNIWDVTDFTLKGGCTKPVGVGNRLFIDEDQSGIFDNGDTILPNIDVQLFKEGQTPNVDTPFKTTTSTGNGFYTFENIPEGKYRIYIPKNQTGLNGYDILSTHGGDDGIDNDNNGYKDFGGYVSNLFELKSGTEPTNEPSFSNLFSLPDADVDETIDFGFVKVGSISGNVSGYDNTIGGYKNLPNITITLYKKDKNNQWILVETKHTDANGNYTFNNLPAGDYKVEEQENITGYSPTLGTDSDDIQDATEDDGDENGYNDPFDNKLFITLLPGEVELGNNFKERLLSNLTPVELANFSAKEQNENSVLSWETATEINNKEFIVEFSTDGIDFERIGQVAGFGTTNQTQFYTFTHFDSFKKNNDKQTLYYRLKQVDYDGTFTHSSIQSLKVRATNNENKTVIYPNPVYSGQDIHIWNEDTIQSFIVISSMGQIVHEEENIQTNEFTLNVSSLSKGTYFIYFQNGVISKFVIQ